MREYEGFFMLQFIVNKFNRCSIAGLQKQHNAGWIISEIL